LEKARVSGLFPLLERLSGQDVAVMRASKDFPIFQKSYAQPVDNIRIVF